MLVVLLGSFKKWHQCDQFHIYLKHPKKYRDEYFLSFQDATVWVWHSRLLYTHGANGFQVVKYLLLWQAHFKRVHGIACVAWVYG